MTGFRISKCIYKVIDTDPIQKHFSESGVKLDNMMKGTGDASAKTLVFGGIEAIN